jgi:hypothetical protein
MNINIYILLVTIGCLYGVYHIYHHKKTDYMVLFQYITAISTAILALSVIGTFVEIQKNNTSATIKNYDEISDEIFDKIIELFLDNEDMNYLYNNLFLHEPINSNACRNMTKEHEITSIIFSKFSKVLELINEKELNNENSIILRVYSMMDNLMESKLMQDYWLIYKNTFNAKLTSKFMHERYGL